MKQVFITLFKNAILVLAVAISIISFWNGFLKWKDLLSVQIGLGVLFVFLNYYEFQNASYRAKIPVNRFAYFPYSFFMLKILKACFFISFALMLISSGSRVRYLYPICLVLAINELIVLFLKYKKRLCFVSIFDSYLLFSKTIIYKVFASDIEQIEFRHDIFYIIRKNKKSDDIRLLNIENKEEFVKSISAWIVKNKIILSSEAKGKLELYTNSFS